MNATRYLEHQIMKCCIDELTAQAATITVNDGEEDTLLDSSDPVVILNAMRTSDKDRIFVSVQGVRGWIYFVYGNDGWDVINDYTINLEPFLTKTNALIDEMAA
jgi:hypothetical protein